MSAPAIELHRVTVQRIACAVEASKRRPVELRVDGSDDTGYLVWWDGLRHVIASGSERGMKLLLPVVRAEFERQKFAAEFEGSTVQRVG